MVAGAGPIGILVTQAARAFGASRVVVSDPVGLRRERARQLGATSVVDPLTEDVSGLDPEVDVFIDASGAAAAVAAGIRALRPGGNAVLVGVGATEALLPVSTIQDREITVTGTFRSTGTWPLATHLVSSGQVDLDSLVTARYDLESVGAALAASAIRTASSRSSNRRREPHRLGERALRRLAAVVITASARSPTDTVGIRADPVIWPPGTEHDRGGPTGTTPAGTSRGPC